MVSSFRLLAVFSDQAAGHPVVVMLGYLRGVSSAFVFTTG